MDNRPLLKKVQNSKETHIILDCEADNILDYLRQAHEVNLLGDYQVLQLHMHITVFASGHL